MASENKNENIMLTGQTAYFKKSGSMVNRGTLNIANALTARSYAEGYIGPDSVLHGTDLATTSEYRNCDSIMREYMGEHWTQKEGERTIITNSNVIKELLKPDCDGIQTIVDSMGFTGTELKYIQSTGTQYIDTGVGKGATSIKYETQFYIAGSTTPDGFLWSSYDSNGYGMGDFYKDNDHGQFAYFYSTNSSVYISSPTVSTYTTYTLVSDMNLTEIKTTLNNTTTTQTRTATPNSSNIVLFRRGNNTSYPGSYRLFYMKIYIDGELARDFIPCKTSSGVVCLYDKVTKTYFYNKGTDTFTAGAVNTNLYKEELDYVETIDNSYTAIASSTSLTSTSPANGFELEFTPMENFDVTDTYGKYILCAATNSTTAENYYLRLCSYPGYENGIIQVGLDGEKIDAKMQMGKRQKIIYKNGILTLPDGSTQELPWYTTNTSYLNWRLGDSRLALENDHATIRIHSCKLYRDNTLIVDTIPVKNNANLAYMYNKTANYLMGKSGVMKLGPVKEEG